MTPKKILFVAAEAAPIVKIGGLADVVGSLPKALRSAGHDVRIVIPKYSVIPTDRYPGHVIHSNLPVVWQGRTVLIKLEEHRLPDSDVPIYFLDCPEMFHAGQVMSGLSGVYANTNDAEILRQELQRFVFFSLAVARTLSEWPWQPEIVHLHDWHASLVTVVGAIMRTTGQSFPPTVLTIHNLQNQGRWSAAEVFSWLGWSGREHPLLQTRDRDGNLNILQLGIHGANGVNTVSPTYAQEILTPEYGEGLSEDLRNRVGGVVGILNGIDEVFNPKTDAALASRYDSSSVNTVKAANKRSLQQDFGLAEDPDALLLGFVGRLVTQKGVDLIVKIIPELARFSAQLVILGSGLPEIEREVVRAVTKSPQRVGAKIGFDAALAQRIYAGADMFLMPSRFEPCGLGQMIAMRYGTLPIVRGTGGLRDSVTDLSAYPESGTGFVFAAPEADELQAAIQRAFAVFREPTRWREAIQRAMAQDFSWIRSAQAYLRLYDQIQKN